MVSKAKYASYLPEQYIVLNINAHAVSSRFRNQPNTLISVLGRHLLNMLGSEEKCCSIIFSLITQNAITVNDVDD